MAGMSRQDGGAAATSDAVLAITPHFPITFMLKALPDANAAGLERRQAGQPASLRLAFSLEGSCVQVKVVDPHAPVASNLGEEVDVQPPRTALLDSGALSRLTTLATALVETVGLPAGFRAAELMSISWNASQGNGWAAVELLSAREREVVERACLGSHNKGIAYDLGLSHSTVRVLMGRAAAKLGVRTRRELLAKVSGRGSCSGGAAVR